ncbi:MAG TPA: hypothetical protein VHN77_04225 [Phycisphaerales bacterium]|nr:hypothetical protein [Phycisphaerales bacterium]
MQVPKWERACLWLWRALVVAMLLFAIHLLGRISIDLRSLMHEFGKAFMGGY